MSSSLQLWTNPVCPFAHRAAFTVKYREPAGGASWHWVPLSSELSKAAKDGVEALNSGLWTDSTPEQMNEIKATYKEKLNASGEVPTVVSASGDIVVESEICAEYLDAIGTAGTPLVPTDPVQVAKMRLAMKKFGDIIGPCYGLLFNKDPAQDAAKVEVIKQKMAAWVSTLAETGPFALGANMSLADVHAAPFLHRFVHTLSAHRNFHILEGFPRAKGLVQAVEKLPAFQETTLPAEKFIQAYSGGAAR